MAENAKNNKKLIILISVIGVIVIGILTAILIIVIGKENAPAEATDPMDNVVNGQIQYDDNVVLIDDGDDIQAAYDAAKKKVEEGMIGLQYNNVATSSDGVNFDCVLGNSDTNSYDIYYDLYTDMNMSQRVFITGLIPPGSGITSFKSQVKYEPGTYEAILVITQVEDDHSTIHATLNVVLTLVVT